MNTIYYIIIYVVLIIAIGSLLAYMIYKHNRNLEIVRDSFHSISEDVKAISEDLKEINRIIDDANRKTEDINRKFEEKNRKDKDGK